ncbi:MULTISPECIES: DUF5316 family protein [Paenibacillus]|jgi:uncharacterized membrane protein YhaH (DUF805 family)|nr:MULTISPECIES: DUF5316 family protein [Paenibacillus]MBO3285771.1 hypothetical protein [Paenibacillus polymyxa]UMY53864.1 DUF5316 domain-containing protein [Paenibacillus peoriae]
MIYDYLWWAGATCIILAIILSGTGVSGDRMRANFYVEQAADPEGKDRKNRWKWSFIFMIIGLLLLALSMILE